MQGIRKLTLLLLILESYLYAWQYKEITHEREDYKENDIQSFWIADLKMAFKPDWKKKSVVFKREVGV